jgi:diguanylate cyclase (GGDEF)-like protein
LARTTEQPQKRVLVVDDSKFVRTTFASILKRSFAVREEVDGEAAWAAIESDASIVMVFTDLDMPKLNGFGLLARMRASGEARIRELPVVVISGNEEPGTTQRARQAGANDFISKSAEAAEVLARLDNVLRLVATRKELEASREVSAKGTQDRVTGTLTPQYLLTESRKRFSYARRHEAELSVMAVRIENFRDLLRAAGKEAASQVIARIAKLISGQLRSEDSIARTAEATFMVVAPGTSGVQMFKVAERLRAQLDQAKLAYRKQPLVLASRFGVASLGMDEPGSVEELMRTALQRLETALTPSAPAPQPAAPAAPLPAEVEQALQTLERADVSRLGAVATEVLRRLHRIAKMIHHRPR